MKRNLFYILSLAFIFSLASCGKEELSKTPTEGNTPFDEEPIEVPEGYFYARFLGSVGALTRAEANSEVGTHNRITHLQYVIYQRKQTTGTETNPYKVYKVNTVFDNTSSTSTAITWPYTGRTIGEILPSGFDYRVVFLGNMSPGLFKKIDNSGVSQTDSIITSIGIGDLYENARIHLPQGEFKDHSCFYWANNEFTSDTKDITIVLQRIVNRIDIRKEPITEISYEKQLVKNHLESNLLMADGAFTKQVCAVLDTLAAAYTYMGTYAYGNTNTGMATDGANLSKWPVLNLLQGNYLTDVFKSWINDIPTEVESDSYASISRKFEYATTTSTSGNAYNNNVLVNIGQYLYNLTHTTGYDNNKLTAIVNYLWGLNHQTYSFANNTGPVFTATSSLPIDILASNLTKQIRERDEFWRGIASFDKYLGASSATTEVYFRIITENMPSSIDLDRNVTDRLNNGGETSLVIKRRYDDTVKDGYLSIYSIGGTDNLNIKEIKSLTSDAYAGGNPLSGWITDNPTDGQTDLPIKQTNEILKSKREANTYYKSLMSVTSMNITDQNTYSGDQALINLNLKYILETLIQFSETGRTWTVSGYKYNLLLGTSELCNQQMYATLSGLNKIINKPIYALYDAQYHKEYGFTERFYGIVGYPFRIKFPLLNATNLSYILGWKLTDNSGNPVIMD